MLMLDPGGRDACLGGSLGGFGAGMGMLGDGTDCPRETGAEGAEHCDCLLRALPTQAECAVSECGRCRP